MLMGKRTIGTVSYMGGIQFVPESFCWSLLQMMQYSTEYVCGIGDIIHLYRPEMSYHATARNAAVAECKGDWLLQLDTDHAFGPDLLQRLLFTMHKYNVDVLCGIYHFRRPPYMPVLFQWDAKNERYDQLADWDRKAEIFEIGSSGGGCLLVKRSVYQRIYKELREEPFSISPPYSEDHSFFNRIRKLGIKAYVAPQVQAAHLEVRPILTEDYHPEEFSVLVKQSECWGV